MEKRIGRQKVAANDEVSEHTAGIVHAKNAHGACLEFRGTRTKR